ncbi:BON domain-containing protein [Cupriavidus basilensis]
MERPDEEIAQAISSALHWNASVPPNVVQITVENGAVTLRGEVDQDFQRRAALDTVRRVHGVKSVANALTLRPASGPADLSDRIAKALQRLAVVDASRLSVSVADGTVTLYGPLRNLNECRAAREAAWDAPGVRAVVDQMWVVSWTQLPVPLLSKTLESEMEKKLIVYYSRTGTARQVAEQMAAQSGWQLAEVTDEHPRAGFLGDARCVIETVFHAARQVSP